MLEAKLKCYKIFTTGDKTMKISDMLLLPRTLYQKTDGKKSTLYLGILLVGVADIAFDAASNWTRIFGNKPEGGLILNILATLLLIIVTGFADAVFFTIPLFDIFKKFRKEEDVKETDNVQRIRLMKVYILAHLAIIPAEIVIYIIVGDGTSLAYNAVTYIAVLLALAVPFLFAAAISRGINSIYRFEPFFRRIVFTVVFIWTYALSYAFDFGVDWLMKLVYGL